MVWRYACDFFRILKLFFITGFLLQYLGNWYRTNDPLVNFTIFNTSNKNKARDINSPWNLLVCFVVYSTRRFVSCRSLCYFVIVFFRPFSIAITSLGEKRANLSAFRMFVRFPLVWFCLFPLPLGRAVVCDCGTPWTFLLPFFLDLRLGRTDCDYVRNINRNDISYEITVCITPWFRIEIFT